MNGHIRARIDDNIRHESARVLDAMGLTIPDVVRMLLTRIAKEKALPIELVTPNAKTIVAMEENRATFNKKNPKPIGKPFSMIGGTIKR